MVHPVPISLPCDQPSLDMLWFSTGPEIPALRLKAFLSVFDCMEFSDLLGVIEDPLLAALCLVTYIALQVQTLSQEDVDAYLSQAVCLRLKNSRELQQIQLPFVCGRAVQLGSLYVRGLSHLLGANSASGCPLPSAALMPWHSFDGRLFHSKYLLAHSSTKKTELLDNDSSCLSQFLQLRELLAEVCMKRGRVLESRPKALPSFRETTGTGNRDRPAGWSPGRDEGWRGRGGSAGGRHRGQGWRERDYGSEYEHRDRLWDGGGHRGGGQTQHFHSFHPEWREEGPQNMSRPPKQSRGRRYNYRGRYQLAPRWSQPPPPGI